MIFSNPMPTTKSCLPPNGFSSSTCPSFLSQPHSTNVLLCSRINSHSYLYFVVLKYFMCLSMFGWITRRFATQKGSLYHVYRPKESQPSFLLFPNLVVFPRDETWEPYAHGCIYFAQNSTTSSSMYSL